MALVLHNFEQKVKDSIIAFWNSREAAKQKQIEAGRFDQGERSKTTGGKNMDGFLSLLIDIVYENGLPHADIYRQKAMLTLPGYFRPTKLWDLLILYRGELVAAIELKSHVGPSFGNNFNNRAEEALGAAHDFWIAYRESGFGNQPCPFVGWIILVEDAPGSRKPVRNDSPHFPVFKDFEGTSYLDRYHLLCQRMMQEKLYTAASVIASEKTAIHTGRYSDLSSMTGLWSFATALAGHVAATAMRLG